MKKQIFCFIFLLLISKTIISQIAQHNSFASVVSNSSIINKNTGTSTQLSYSNLLNRHFAIGVSNSFSLYNSKIFALKSIFRTYDIGLNVQYFFNPQNRNIIFLDIESSTGKEQYFLTGKPNETIHKFNSRLGIGLLSFLKRDSKLVMRTSVNYHINYSKYLEERYTSRFFMINQTIAPIFAGIIDKKIETNKSLLCAERITIAHNLSYTFGNKNVGFISTNSGNLISTYNPLIIDSKLGYFPIKNLELEFAMLISLYAQKENNSYNLTPQINYYVPLKKRFSIFGTTRYSYFLDFQDNFRYWSLGAGLNYFLNKDVAAQATYFFNHSINNYSELNIGLKYFLR